MLFDSIQFKISFIILTVIPKTVLIVPLLADISLFIIEISLYNTT